MKEIIIQAVDIGTTKVAAIIAKKTPNDKLEILGIGTAPSFGVIRADVANINRTVDAIRKAVAEAEAQSGIPFNDVYVGIAGSHINSLQHRAVLMRPEYHEIISEKDIQRLKDDMKRLPLPPGDIIIEILPQEYTVDHIAGVQDPIGMPGSKIEANFHIITGSETAVNNIKRCIYEAGLNVKEVIMQPLASAAAVLCEDELQAGVALVDIGGGTTDIAIFVDGMIGHTAVIPFGGEIITEDIKKGCNILKGTAESVKVQHGCAFANESHDNVVVTIPGVHDRPPREISLKNLASIIQARMEDILDYISNEIEISGLGERLMCGIVFTGGGSKLKHLRQLSEFHTGMETRVGLPNEHLAKSKVQNVDNPIYSTGIGLIIKGLERYNSEHILTETPAQNVENSKNVENTKAVSPENPVVLEDKTKEAEPKIQEERPDSPKQKSGGLSDFFKKAGKRINEWIGDDMDDFTDTK